MSRQAARTHSTPTEIARDGLPRPSVPARGQLQRQSRVSVGSPTVSRDRHLGLPLNRPRPINRQDSSVTYSPIVSALEVGQIQNMSRTPTVDRSQVQSLIDNMYDSLNLLTANPSAVTAITNVLTDLACIRKAILIKKGKTKLL